VASLNPGNMPNEPNQNDEKQPPVNAAADKSADKPAADSVKPAAPTAAAAPLKPPAAAGASPAAVGPTSPAAKPAASAAGAPATAGPPKPPAPPKEAPPKPELLDNDLVKRYKQRFGEGIREAWIDRKQSILVVDVAQYEEVARFTRDVEQFNLLADLTAVDWPRREKRFDVVLNLYSFQKNERLRIKVHVGEKEQISSVAGIWSTANWLEREVWDMFGIVFSGHPNLTRILLPDEWQGFPLRKDYDILTQDTAWIRENLGIESGQ
jgi:NADH-quinone oxidoreductase subunit C